MKVSEIYQKWQAPTIGVRKGLLPILALIYFLANRQHLGLYIENTFITDLTEAYLDEWMQITDRVAFKYVEIGKNENNKIIFEPFEEDKDTFWNKRGEKLNF